MATLSKDELQRQVELLSAGCEAVYTAQDLAARLELCAAKGRQMRVKLGLDPTSPDIHLGHTVVLRKVRQFQDLGHKAVIIIGDYTARIGDPTGQNKTRPVLSPQQIAENAKTYLQQVGRVLDSSPDRLDVRYNSEWLEKLTFAEVLKLAAQMTVARMMERDTFDKRFKAGVPIGVHEFLYPLMQGYDSVCIQADVEFGGSDQTFNNLIGRQLQENAGQLPQIVMIMPLLVGLDGVEKMSKSKGNYIGVSDEPNDMFGKVMSIPDSLMTNYIQTLNFTFDKPLGDGAIKLLLDPAQTHPRQAKATLGRLIVETYYGAEAGKAAVEEFDRVFSHKENPADMPEIRPPAAKVGIIDLIISAGFAKSKSEARRLIDQKAVKLDDQTITDPAAAPELKTGQVLRVGKLRFGRIVI
ncbi:MAG: tyrosine--tRNA ligase [Planctomycetes bacterium]|nr:tyrosine--tRNA ligase [Planctomycetota bacterium]